MTVCVGHLLKSTVAVLVGVLNQLFALAFDADGFQVMEGIVGKRILHAVATDDLGHVVKGVVSVGNVGKLVAAGKCGLWWGIAKVFFGGDKKLRTS